MSTKCDVEGNREFLCARLTFVIGNFFNVAMLDRIYQTHILLRKSRILELGAMQN